MLSQCLDYLLKAAIGRLSQSAILVIAAVGAI